MNTMRDGEAFWCAPYDMHASHMKRRQNTLNRIYVVCSLFSRCQSHIIFMIHVHSSFLNSFRAFFCVLWMCLNVVVVFSAEYLLAFFCWRSFLFLSRDSYDNFYLWNITRPIFPFMARMPLLYSLFCSLLLDFHCDKRREKANRALNTIFLSSFLSQINNINRDQRNTAEIMCTCFRYRCIACGPYSRTLKCIYLKHTLNAADAYRAVICQ